MHDTARSSIVTSLLLVHNPASTGNSNQGTVSSLPCVAFAFGLISDAGRVQTPRIDCWIINQLPCTLKQRTNKIVMDRISSNGLFSMQQTVKCQNVEEYDNSQRSKIHKKRTVSIGPNVIG